MLQKIFYSGSEEYSPRPETSQLLYICIQLFMTLSGKHVLPIQSAAYLNMESGKGTYVHFLSPSGRILETKGWNLASQNSWRLSKEEDLSLKSDVAGLIHGV